MLQRFASFQNAYLIDLAEYYLVSGQIIRALRTTDQVLKDQSIGST